MEQRPNVFVSYAQEDREAAASVASYVQGLGLDAWWDRELSIGADIHERVLQQIRDADAVIVLWSQHSVSSHWVRGEAQAGLDAGKLIPIRIDHCDPPLNFRAVLTLDAIGWRTGGFDDPRLENTLRRLSASSSSSTGEQSQQSKSEARTLEYITAGGLALIAVVLAVLLSDWDAQSSFAPNYLAGVIAPLGGCVLLAIESGASHVFPRLASMKQRFLVRRVTYYILPLIMMRAAFPYFQQHLPAVAADVNGAAVLANFMVSAAIGIVILPVLWSIPALIAAYLAARGSD